MNKIAQLLEISRLPKSIFKDLKSKLSLNESLEFPDPWFQVFADQEGVNVSELHMGYEVEKEHLDSMDYLMDLFVHSVDFGDDQELEDIYNQHKQVVILLAPMFIAIDHLHELPDYYTKLKVMEGSNPTEPSGEIQSPTGE